MRKLSELQMWILRAALDPKLVKSDLERDRGSEIEKEVQRDIARGESPRAARSIRKIFEAIDDGEKWTPGRWGTVHYCQVKEFYFGLRREHTSNRWVFAKQATANYQAVSNSVSRAASRLKTRGLVALQSRDGEIAPTIEGYAMAANIEMQTPAAFGFTPIPRHYLERIIAESRRIPSERRRALNGGYPNSSRRAVRNIE
jgi:hypothetical protein